MLTIYDAQIEASGLSGVTIDGSSSIDDTNIGSSIPGLAKFITPGSNDNSQNAATTAWVQSLLASYAPGSGSATLAGGLVIKWGSAGGSNPQNVTFNVAFPNGLYVVLVTSLDFGTGATRNVVYLTSQSNTGFSAQTDSTSVAFNWLAVGH